jgi:hypothetical protein
MKNILFCSLFLLTSACSTHITDLSVLSNKNISLEEIDIDNVHQRKYVSGVDSKWNIFFIPFGRPKVKEALNDALRKGDGDLIIDAAVYYNSWWFLVGQREIEIKGTVVNTRED